MVFMITGDINVGKTTIIEKICKQFSESISGFCTREYFNENIREGFYISDIASGSKASDENIIAKMDVNFKPIVFAHVFENQGVKLASQCLNSNKPIIIIDEIGVFESKSQNFIKYLDKILQSEKIVIAVLKKREHEFLNKYKELYNPVQITIENRDEVANSLMNKIRGNL